MPSAALDCRDIDSVKGFHYSPQVESAFGPVADYDPYGRGSRNLHLRDLRLVSEMGANVLFLAPWDSAWGHQEFLSLALRNGLCVAPAFDISPFRGDKVWQGPERTVVEQDLRLNWKGFVESLMALDGNNRLEFHEAIAMVIIYGLPDAHSLLPNSCLLPGDLSHSLNNCLKIAGEELEQRIHTTQDILQIMSQEFRDTEQRLCIDGDPRCAPLLGANVEMAPAFSFAKNYPLNGTGEAEEDFVQALTIWLQQVLSCWPVTAGPIRVDSTDTCAGGGLMGYLDFWSLSVAIAANHDEVDALLRATSAFDSNWTYNNRTSVVLSVSIPRIRRGQPDSHTQQELLQHLYDGAVEVTGVWGVAFPLLDDPKAPLRHALCRSPSMRSKPCGPSTAFEQLAVGSMGSWRQLSRNGKHCVVVDAGIFTFDRQYPVNGESLVECAWMGTPGGFATYLYGGVIGLTLLPCLGFVCTAVPRCCLRHRNGVGSNTGMREGAPEKKSKTRSNERYGQWLAEKVADALTHGETVPTSCVHLRDRYGWGLAFRDKVFRYYRFKATWSNSPREVANLQNCQWDKDNKLEFVLWLSKESDCSMHRRGYSKNEGMSPELIGVNVVTRKLLLQAVGNAEAKKEKGKKKAKKEVYSLAAAQNMSTGIRVKITLKSTVNMAWLSEVLGLDKVDEERSKGWPNEESGQNVEKACEQQTVRFLSFQAKSHLAVAGEIVEGLIKQEADLLARDDPEAGLAKGASNFIREACAKILNRSDFLQQDLPENFEEQVADLLLIYFLTSIGEHCLHCPRYLRQVFNKAVLTKTESEAEDSVKVFNFEVDHDDLRAPLEDIARNSDTFVRGEGKGKNFDDIDDSKVGDIKKTFPEPSGASVILHLLVNFQWPITIVLWNTILALIAASADPLREFECKNPKPNTLHANPQWLLRFDLFWVILLKLLQREFLPFDLPNPPPSDFCIFPLVPQAPPVRSSGVCLDQSFRVIRWLGESVTLAICIFLLVLQFMSEEAQERNFGFLGFRFLGLSAREHLSGSWLMLLLWLPLRWGLSAVHRCAGTGGVCARVRAAARGCFAELKKGTVAHQGFDKPDALPAKALSWALPALAAVLLLFLVLRTMLVPVLESLTPTGLCGWGDSSDEFCQEIGTFPFRQPKCITCLTALGGLWSLFALSALMIPCFLFDLLASLVGSLLGAKRGFSPMADSSQVNLECTDDIPETLQMTERKKMAEQMTHGTLLKAVFGQKWTHVWKTLVESLHEDNLIRKSQKEKLGNTDKPEEVAAAIPHLTKAAQERIDLFFQSTRAVLGDDDVGFDPTKQSLDKRRPIPSVTQIIPVFDEDVLVKPKDLDLGTGQISLLRFLKSRKKEEWRRFESELDQQLLGSALAKLKEKGGLSDEERKAVWKVRCWASRWSQSVAKTVWGALKYQKALGVLGLREERGPSNRVQLILAHQTYGRRKENSREDMECEKDVHDMLKDANDMFKDSILQVCIDFHRGNCYPDLANLIDQHCRETLEGIDGDLRKEKTHVELSQEERKRKFVHASVLLEYDAEKEESEWPVKVVHVLPRAYPLRIGSQDKHLSLGKPGNQLGALRFAKCLYLQLLDCNMGCDAEEAFKVPIVLEIFRRRPKVCMVGFPEEIFTGEHGLIGMTTAEAEANFGRAIQRWLGYLGVRMNYGHPDFVDAVWARFFGSMSKASAHINLSEDIFAGLTAKWKGFVSVHTDVHREKKGRETVFVSVARFIKKITSGSLGVARSRDLQRLCSAADPLKVCKLFFATVGFYVQQALAECSTRLYLGSLLLLALSSKTTSDLGALNALLTVEWLLTPALSIIASVVRGLCEKRFSVWVQEYAVYIPFLVPYHNFMNKLVAETFIQTTFCNLAEYVKTGRPHASKHYELLETYKFFWTTHYEQAITYLYALFALRVSQGGTNMPMILLTVSAFSWIESPVFYRPPPSRKASFEDMGRVLSFVTRIKPEGSEKTEERSLYEIMLNKEVERSGRPYVCELLARVIFLGLLIVAMDASIWNHVRALVFVWAVGVATFQLSSHFRLSEGSNFLPLSAVFVLLALVFSRDFVVGFDWSSLLFAVMVFLFVGETLKLFYWLFMEYVVQPPLIWWGYHVNEEQIVRLGFDGLCKGQVLLLSAWVVLLLQFLLECLLLLINGDLLPQPEEPQEQQQPTQPPRQQGKRPWKLRTRLILGCTIDDA